MAVLSQEFGGIQLSGDDATTFLRQILDAKPSDQAKKNLARGRDLLAQLDRKGKATVTIESGSK